MKKLYIIFFTLFCLFCTTNARAFFPVIDFKAIGEDIYANITMVDQKIQSVTKAKSTIKMTKIVGDIKKGLEKLADWKEQIDEYIDLFEQGLDLIDESLRTIDDAIEVIELMKDTYSEIVSWGTEAYNIALEASELITEADDYARRYEQSFLEAEAALNSPDETVLAKAKALHAEAVELNNITRDYVNKAEYAADRADYLLYRISNAYQLLNRYNREVIYFNERSCMLKIKAAQYKAELKRKACENKQTAKLVPAEYCEDEEADENAYAKEDEGFEDSADACRTTTKNVLDQVIITKDEEGNLVW